MSLIKLKSPITVNLAITEKCNQECNFCFVNSDYRGKNFPLDKIKKVLDECARADVFNIKLFGGEPFIHPDVVEITKYAYNKGFDVAFSSNGTLIDEKMVKNIKDYISAGAISIHGFKDTHEKIINRKNFFKKSLNAIEVLTSYNIPTGILYTFTKENKNELYSFGKFILDSYDVGAFTVDRFVPLGRGTEKLSPSVEEYNKAFSELLELKREYPETIVELGDSFPFCLLEKEEYKEVVRGGCSAGHSFCEIDGCGNLKICPSFHYSVGNILQTSLEEIWQNMEELNKYRNLEIYLPEYCKTCKDFEECMGGCRASSKEGEILLKYKK